MKIGSIGYNYVHDMKYENFVMDRPKGPGAVLLLLIKTPAVFKVGGVQYQVKENSFILMSADTPCYYTAQENVYTDDWVYFENDYWDKAKSWGYRWTYPYIWEILTSFLTLYTYLSTSIIRVR
mgnify:CR=1 FL=1